MPFQPITTPNVADAAADQLRRLIAADVLRPGDALPGERDLAARMGISRTSLRAALQALTAEGLLVSRHGAGLWVSSDIGRSIADPLLRLIETTPQGLSDYLKFRIMMESDCAACTAEQATPAERRQIDDIHDRMQTAFHAGDLDLSMALDTEFHMAIVEATGNVVTIQIARSLHDLLDKNVRDNHRAAYEITADLSALNAQHSRINLAIQEGDASDARTAMQEHLSYFDGLVQRHADATRRAMLVGQRKEWSGKRVI